jgi:hypothetical protein
VPGDPWRCYSHGIQINTDMSSTSIFVIGVLVEVIVVVSNCISSFNV